MRLCTPCAKVAKKEMRNAEMKRSKNLFMDMDSMEDRKLRHLFCFGLSLWFIRDCVFVG